jgi:hypothetical protein
VGARPRSEWTSAAAWGAADLGVLLIIWLTALVVGGIVGFRVAELSTLVCAFWRLLGRIPPGRPDQAYLVWLWRALTKRDRPPRTSQARAMRGRVAARGCLLVAAVAVIVIQSAFPRAPSTADLPLAASASVIASVSSGSDIDTAYDHHRYRYLVLAGPQAISGPTLLHDEVRHLISQGWNCTTDQLVHLKPSGERYAVLPRRCPTPLPRAGATLISTDKDLRLDLIVVTSQDDADQDADGTPLEGNHSLRRAQQNRRPVLWANLAHGT